MPDLDQGKDIQSRENFVRSYNEALNEREKSIKEKEDSLAKREVVLAAGAPALDEKQALIASRIAQNEELLKKIQVAEDSLSEKKAQLALERESTQLLMDELKEKVLALSNRESGIREKEAEIDELKKNITEKDKQLKEKDKELGQKQAAIERMNKDMNLQQRELDAVQKKVQRIITLNQMEKELGNA